jgi:alpha-mannosidase
MDMLERLPQNLAPSISVVAFSDPDVVLSSFKQAEEGGRVILRGFNPKSAVADLMVETGFPVKAVSNVTLQEAPLPSWDVSPVLEGPTTIRLTVPAKKVFNLALDL